MSNHGDKEGGSLVHGDEIVKHKSRDSCWVVISGQVYDLTEFLDDHPGGAAVILKYGGKVSYTSPSQDPNSIS
jgi:cytochrome b involved in lipid metabolism